MLKVALIVFGIAVLVLTTTVIVLSRNLIKTKEKLSDLQKNVVILEDSVPKTNSNLAKAMKLSNELGEFIAEKDGKIYLKVLK